MHFISQNNKEKPICVDPADQTLINLPINNDLDA